MLTRRITFRVTALGALAALVLAGCGSKGTTGPTQSGPSGMYTGTFVGSGVSGVLMVTFPAAPASVLPASSLHFSLVPAANAAAAPISITGTLVITGGSIIPLNGTYDPSATPQLTVIGGGFTITGNYSASNGQFSGSFSDPSGGSGQWTASAGGTTVRVFCGTYINGANGGSGTLNVVLDASGRLSGVVNTPKGPLELQGSYSAGSNPNLSLTFPGGSVNGTADPSTGDAGGGWSDNTGAGGTWWASTTLCSPPPRDAKLYGVFAIDPSNVLAVGEAGTILFSNNSKSWSFRASGTTNTLYAMGPGLFVVGAGGTILQYNPTTFAWSPQPSGTTNALYGVSRAPGGGFFAVGAAGTILYYNGTSWSPQTGVPTMSTLYSVAKVPGLPYAFAVGAGGTILFYNGTSWVLQDGGTSKDLFFVDVIYYADPRGTSVYATGAGGTILHYDGTTWTAQTSGTTSALHGGTGGLNWAVGDGGTILYSPDGSTWGPQASGTTDDLTGASAALPNDVFAVGDKGTILHYDGMAWARQQ